MEHVYQLELTPDALKLIYKSVDFHHQHWAGGDPLEQEALVYLKGLLFKCVLEKHSNRTHDATPWNGVWYFEYFNA